MTAQTTAHPAGALAGLTVIETAERVSGEYTAKLLADLGATVIKIEAPGGAPTRRMGPFKAGESALFAYLNANKKSVVLDLANPGERALLDRLLARADALVDDHDEPWAETHALSPAVIAQAHPRLVHCIVTPFGQGAPPEWQTARPINVINAGGWAYHSPSETPNDKPPLKGAGRFLSDYEAGIDAALCVMASLLRQRRTGMGQFIDISEVEVQLNRIDCVLDRMIAGEADPSAARTAYDMGGPGTSFACKDGHVFLFMTTRGHWNALRGLMGDPAWAREFREDWLEFDCVPANVARFRQHFAAWIAGQDKLPITEAAQKAGVAMVPVNTAADLPRHEQFEHRGFFQQAGHPVFGPVAYPTACYRMSATPVRIASAAPALGADNREVEASDADA
ncbi:CaiB/BaiF CoA transferase family protein [Novosphingobium album (ex Liu et al. 2023)]|uniref:CoA transferase n=1 Tax=Novosphingobium album (ex Liu et al. 2023) TaxID=3031130 RepID=A0ABT5WTT1_9SPHN|nr:CoA transferase [Novosphingobium album (ex Liu et al. 2023)]MDE8653286.1 CoA transferase [Novosphingobium album (ex Liu et al. 2023)]